MKSNCLTAALVFALFSVPSDPVNSEPVKSHNAEFCAYSSSSSSESGDCRFDSMEECERENGGGASRICARNPSTHIGNENHNRDVNADKDDYMRYSKDYARSGEINNNKNLNIFYGNGSKSSDPRDSRTYACSRNSLPGDGICTPKGNGTYQCFKHCP